MLNVFRLRIGALLHFLIAIGHLICLFFLEEAFKAYGILDEMKRLCFGQKWLLYAVTVCLAVGFAIAGFYALSVAGDMRKLPLHRLVMIAIVGLYSIRVIVGIDWLLYEFTYLQFFSTLVPALLVYCYLPGLKREKQVKKNDMKKEINPRETSRAAAFELWMSSPMPMVTLTKTFDVSRILKISRKRGWKFNMILCWAIGCAASRTREFYLLPEKESSKGISDEEDSQEKESGSSWRLMQYDSIAINVIVENKKGGINSCDIPYSDDIQKFNEDYLRLTSEAAAECKSSSLENMMVVGTSAMIGMELDCIVNQYTDLFCNPMLMWGSYNRGFFRTTLPISFQFHHVQMDGGEAARFMELLQAIMKIARL